MKIALVSGAWSSNIGNAFYNLGGIYLLEKLNVGEVFFVPETPRWRVYNLTVQDFDLTRYLEVDLIILNGPCFFYRLKEIFEETFNELKKRGVKIGFISAGMMRYTQEEADEVISFLNKFEPAFITTRDSETFNFFNGKVKNCEVYDGICNSMFLNDAVRVPDLNIKDYYIYNFDADHEPIITFEDNIFKITPYRKKTFFSKKRKLPQSLNEKRIIRTSNNSIDSPIEQIYFTDNTYHSDLPYGYISIIKNADTVFSERVHTCATALIMGRKAYFIPIASRSHDNRSYLFKRLKVEEIFQKPTQLDMKYIENEKLKLEDFLRTTFKHKFNI